MYICLLFAVILNMLLKFFCQAAFTLNCQDFDQFNFCFEKDEDNNKESQL